MKSTYKLISKYILLFICILILLSACLPTKDETIEYIIKEDLLVIDGISISIGEIMLYLLQVRLDFEQLGGEDVWDINDFSGGKKARDVAKQVVLENLIKTRILGERSKDMGVRLTQQEEDEVKAQALKYFNDLKQQDIEDYGITDEIVHHSFRESLLAEKVIEATTKNYEPEEEKIIQLIMENNEYNELRDKNPEEVLTQINVLHIHVKTHEKDKVGVLVPKEDMTTKEAEQKANMILEKAKNSKDFIKLVETYSDDEIAKANNGEWIFSYALVMDEIREGINNLRVGDISEIINTKYGYHILKLQEIKKPSQEEIDEYMVRFQQWEERLRYESIKLLKKEAFNEIYDEWKNNAIIELNREKWNQMDISGSINE